MSKKKLWIICGCIILITILVIAGIFMTEPTAQSEGATKETAMLVSIVNVNKGTFQPVITATGTVQPVEDIMLSPLVNGQVIKRSSGFVPGGFVNKGEILLQINPSDYRNTLELRKSELLQAETELEMEMGRQEIAEQDLQLVGGDSLSSQQRLLVLRKPQFNAVKATIKAAQAAVNQAQLNLDRTTIRAPFDAHIIDQNVTIGSQVGPGDNLGRLVGIEQYWINVTVPVGKLKWLSFPDSGNETGNTAKIQNTTAWGKEEFRTGYLNQLIGALDNQTRLARVLIRVPDPLSNNAENTSKPRMIIGSFVEAQIQCDSVENVIRLNRDFVRNNQTVWVMDQGKLSIREVEIVLTDSDYAYISEGLQNNEKVVTTNISTVTNGVPLRTETDTVPDSDQSPENL